MLEVTLIFLALILAGVFTSERDYNEMIRAEIEDGLRDGSIEANTKRGKR